MTIRVGFVIPCKDEEATIEQCLLALRAQDPPPTSIVVIDNGSTDGSTEIARRLADEVIVVPSITIGTMRNRGAWALSEPDVIAFVDADCEVGPGWIAAALDGLNRADVVSSRTEAAPGATWVASRWAAIEAREQHDGSAVWGQQLAIRAEVFARLRGFDETIPTGEEIDLSRRVRDGGGRIEFVPGMVAIHHGFPSTISGFLRRERWHTRAPGWLSRMSRKSRSLVVVGAGWTVVGAIAIARGAATGDIASLTVWLGGTAAAIPTLGLASGRSPRTAVQDGILISLWAGVRIARLPYEIVAGRRV